MGNVMIPIAEPATKAGRWLLSNTRWDDGMRGFFVRINATAGPEDMRVHVLAIEAEARDDQSYEETHLRGYKAGRTFERDRIRRGVGEIDTADFDYDPVATDVINRVLAIIGEERP